MLFGVPLLARYTPAAGGGEVPTVHDTIEGNGSSLTFGGGTPPSGRGLLLFTRTNNGTGTWSPSGVAASWALQSGFYFNNSGDDHRIGCWFGTSNGSGAVITLNPSGGSAIHACAMHLDPCSVSVIDVFQNATGTSHFHADSSGTTEASACLLAAWISSSANASGFTMTDGGWTNMADSGQRIEGHYKGFASGVSGERAPCSSGISTSNCIAALITLVET